MDLLKRIEYYGWGLTALLAIAALVARYPLVASGCALGGTLSVLHFKWLAMFLRNVVDPHKHPSGRMKKLALGAYLAKYLIITGVVYLLFRFGLVEPWGFLGGLSVIFVAICIAGLAHISPLGEPQG